MMSSIFLPIKIEYGVNSCLNAGKEFRLLDCEKIMVVSDQGIVKSGLLDPILKSLKQENIDTVIFDKVVPDPTIECVTSAGDLYRNEKCDGILVIGGGSSIDTAKGAAVLATNPGPIMNYAGMDKIIHPLPPIIAIPTTCGTGSEVTNVTVITDENHYKNPFVSNQLIPKVAILDPELLRTLPPHLIASTGMDALTHAMEALTNKLENWYADACAWKAIRMIGESIEPAVNKNDFNALSNMLYASTLAGVSFTLARLGLVHAMSHPISGFAGVPHGLANAVLLPYVMSFNVAGNPEGYAAVARELGVADQGDALRTAEMGVQKIIELNEQLSIPKSFKELGVKEEMFPQMIEDTFKSGNIAINPREVTKEDVEKIYQLSFNGESPLYFFKEMSV